MLKRLLYLALLLPLTMLAQISPNRPIQAYQSTSFSVTPTDFSQSVVYPLNGTANITVTLLSTAPPNGQCIGLRQEGSGGVIINANGVTATGNLTIQPASSVLPTSANICSDGATYKVDQSGQVSGGATFTLSPSTVAFPSVQLGQASTVTVTAYCGTGSPSNNPIPSPLPCSITGVATAETGNPAILDFSMTANTCPSNLGAGSSCIINTTFSPVAANCGTPPCSETGTLTVTANGGSYVSNLTGTAIASSTKTLQTITVMPSNLNANVGGTVPASATEGFSDTSTQNFGTGVSWFSDTISVATVDQSGVVSGVLTGTANIVANSGFLNSSAIGTFNSGTGGSGTPQVQTSLIGNERCVNNGSNACTSSTGVATTANWQQLIFCRSAGATACVVSDSVGDSFSDIGTGFHNNEQVFIAKNGSNYGTKGERQ